jgi:hypothetical protein
MKQISPIQSWINGKSVTATIFNMYVIGGVLGSSASFYYSLLDENLANVAQGNLTMSGEAYLGWGNDDEYAWLWSASPEQLNLTITGDYVPPVPEVVETPSEPLNSILADLRQDAPIDEILGEMN